MRSFSSDELRYCRILENKNQLEGKMDMNTIRIVSLGLFLSYPRH